MSAVICDQSERKVYRKLVRPEVTKGQEAELKMERFCLEETRTDRRRSDVWETQLEGLE